MILREASSDSSRCSRNGTAAKADDRDTVSAHRELAQQDRDQFLRRRGRPNYRQGNAGDICIVDLFCGCGGMTLGMAEAARRAGHGVKIPLAMDSDPDVISVYESNFGFAKTQTGSVESLFDGALDKRLTSLELRTREDVGHVDALLGGPPCQGNSDLNNHTRRDDSRNALYARMARAARVLRPSLILIENVPAVTHDRGGVVDETARALKRLRYTVTDRVLSLSRLGVPQLRKRHLLVASAEKWFDPASVFDTLELTGRPTRDVAWAIEDLLDLSGKADWDRAGNATEENRRRIDWLFDHNTYVLDDSERPTCHRDKPHSYRSVYGRMRWDGPAQTITTGFGSMGQGCYVHPKRRRTITPHEAARLQTFPDFFRFDSVSGRGKWAKMIGNAVPPLVTLRLGEHWLQQRKTRDLPPDRG